MVRRVYLSDRCKPQVPAERGSGSLRAGADRIKALGPDGISGVRRKRKSRFFQEKILPAQKRRCERKAPSERNLRGAFLVAGIPGFIHDGIIGMADGIEALNGCNLKTEIFQKFNIETEVANNMNILVSGFQKELGDISCIHIGKNGPGSSCIVNGRPVSGAFGFQGEVGFNFYDEHRTFREIALEGYQNIDMIEYTGRLLLQIITVINPYKLYLYPLTDINIEELQNYCLRYVPQEAMPQIILKKTYDKDYQYSLLSRGIHLLQAII